PPDSVLVQIRFDVVIVAVIAQVPVELAVIGVPRIAYVRAPYLLARLDVPPERRHTRGCNDRRIDSPARLGASEHDRVGIYYEELQPLLGQQPINSRLVGAFRQPYSARGPAKMLFVIGAADCDLRPSGLRFGNKRKEAVCRAGSDYLDSIGVL